MLKKSFAILPMHERFVMLNKNSMMSGKIIFNRQINRDHFLISLKVPGAKSSFNEAIPGQFAMLRVKGKDIPFLGRPLSIYSLHQDDDGIIVEFLYRVVGKGTHVISRLRPGEEMSLLGPLGHGFDIFPDRDFVVLIAGGVGIAPLSFLGECYRQYAVNTTPKIVCYVGARSSDLLVGLDRMEKICSDIRISTDDGSSGHRGSVCDLFGRDITSYDSSDSVVYCCGPAPMIKRFAQLLMEHPLLCQVSIEERMACGVGACLGCAVSVKSGYKRVCKDGPVFDIDEINWE